MSLNTAHESGIPPARDRLALGTESDAALEQLELVLVESTRAEANLGLLLRGLKHLAAGASAAQEANAVLMQELDALRGRLGRVYENESLLQKRVVALENALDNAARERDSWLVQEDAFLAGLIDEHEQRVFDLERGHERKLAQLDLVIEDLHREQHIFRTDLQRLTYEREAAVALLSEPSAGTERTPFSDRLAASEAPASPGRLGSVKLPPPAAVHRVKTDPGLRPSGGYSLVADETGDDDDRRITSRPPRP